MPSSVDHSTARALIEEAPIGIFEVDTNGDYTDVNPTACEILGYSRDELLDMSITDVSSTSDEFEDLTLFFDVQEQGHARTETVLRHKDGHEIDVILDAVRIEDRLVGYVQEIAESKEYERELERREAKYRSLFEDNRDAVMLLDRDGFLECNEKTLELFGVDSVDAFVELTPWELSPDTQPDGTESKQAAQAYIETAFEEGEAFFEWTHKRRDGTEFPAEVKLSKFQLEGRPALTALVRDITERTEYEQRLKESEERHRSMTNALDTSNVGTFILDDEFQIVWLNQAVEEFFDVNRDDLIGTDKRTTIKSEIKQIFEHPDRFEQTVLASHEENNHVESFECHVLPDAEREERWLIHWSTPITTGKYAGGRIEHYTDITERKQYENRLEEQRNDLKILNQILRHDIRNDLQLVTSYTDFLRDKCDHEEELEYLEIIQESADHAVELTTTARNMADAMLTDETDLQNVNLGTVLNQELEGLRSDYPQAVVTTEAPIPDVRVRANEMLDSVFRNVLKNAAQHNDREIPEVSVSATVGNETVSIRIADNGPGVPDGQKAEIFGEGEKGLDSAGSGMGLYLVRTLVESYGGDVWVEDNEPTGAVFVVELPLA